MFYVHFIIFACRAIKTFLRIELNLNIRFLEDTPDSYATTLSIYSHVRFIYLVTDFFLCVHNDEGGAR